MLPRGLPVGVAARGLDGSWRVKLFSNEGSIDFVRVLLFDDFAQLVQADTLNAAPLASLNTAPPPSPELAAKIEALHPAHTYVAASGQPGTAAKPAPTAAAAPPTTPSKPASAKPASSKPAASSPPKKAKPKAVPSDDEALPGGNRP
jgi:rod shape-determining protein MreC